MHSQTVTRNPDNDDMAVWKKLLIQIVPIVFAVVISVTGAYIALNSQVSVLAVEVGRLTKVVDSLSNDNQQNRGLASEVIKLTTAVEGLKSETIKAAMREAVLEQTRAKVTKLEVDVPSLVTVLNDLRVTSKVLEREVENIRQDLKRLNK